MRAKLLSSKKEIKKALDELYYNEKLDVQEELASYEAELEERKFYFNFDCRSFFNPDEDDNLIAPQGD